ncbi:universal stress protein [Halonotius pteroides]|uniref:Universal stress protein n=1 Tax=Halonotius pteroides TaxID=268735 RepID=A0A3A6QBL9_9EURY|nr:universal stress protein [Halonotius pteroides]RJX50458.1 universal stress protein [Halonotius pteroides]
MTTFVVATDSVHTSAALCDYLFDRVDEADTVYAVNSPHDDAPEASRDGKDALNAVASRLAAVTTVETEQFNPGNAPVADIRSFAEAVDADEVVIGVRTPTETGTVAIGDINEQVLLQSDRPTVVVPHELEI